MGCLCYIRHFRHHNHTLTMKDITDLGLILKSRVPLVIIESYEEDRALDLLTRIAIKTPVSGQSLYAWSLTDGLRPLAFSATDNHETNITEPEEVLKVIKAGRTPDIYVLCDFHPFLSTDYPKNTRLLKDVCLDYAKVAKTIVLLSHAVSVPPELKRFSAHFEMSLPSDEQILAIIREEAKRWSVDNGNARIKTDNVTLQKIVNNLRGLTHGDVRKLAQDLINDGAIQDDDIPEINRAKFQLLDMDNVLSYQYDTEKFSSVGGLDNLKRWLQERQRVFFNQKPGNIDPPRGILLLGVQGSGKSLAAKAVAGMWGLPLLRVDMAALYNKFIGETERNLREAIKLADTMAPCVLWFDEIEKGLARDNNDTGTSQRILGTLLTWMAERKAPVFVVATSNDISGLPPELIRKGRLDEIFFVDLPTDAVRRSIFEIHLRKRGLAPEKFDLAALTTASDGFSGAEIEQAVVSALYCAEARNESLTTDHVLQEIRSTSPISVVMREDIEALRAWAADRTVPAN